MRCWTDWSRRVQRPIKLLNTSSSKLLCWRRKLVRNSLSYDKLVSRVVNMKCSSEKMRTWTTSLVLSAFQVCFRFSKTELVKVAPFHCLVVCGYFEAAYSEIKKHEWREDPMAQRFWKCNIWYFSFSGVEKHLGRVWDYDFAWVCYCFFTTMGFSKEYCTFTFDILHRSVSVNEGAPYSKCV